MTAATPNGFDVDTDRSTIVRQRYTRWWRSSDACMSRAPGGWTRVTARRLRPRGRPRGAATGHRSGLHRDRRRRMSADNRPGSRDTGRLTFPFRARPRPLPSPAWLARSGPADRAVLRRVLPLPAGPRTRRRPGRASVRQRARGRSASSSGSGSSSSRASTAGRRRTRASSTSRAGCTSTRTSRSRPSRWRGIYLRRNERFYFVRNMFMVAMGIALVLLRARSRPRRRGCCPSGASPTRSRRSPASTTTRGPIGVLFNPFAAIPSMHVALLADARHADGADGAPPLGQGAVVRVLAARHLRGRSRRPTTGGSTRFLGAAVAAVSAVAAWGCSPARGQKRGRGTPAVRAPDQAPCGFECRSRTHNLSAMSSPPAERPPRTAREYQALMRNRLIESRLTPNAISLTGLALCVVAAVLVWRGVLVPRRPRVHRRIGLRHARRPLLAHVRQGHAVRRVPGLDARPHGGGDRARRGRARTSPARATTSRSAAVVVAVLASLMVSYTRARAEALGVECKVGIADRPVRVVILSVGLVFAVAQLSTSSCSRPPSRSSPRCRPSRSSSASGTCARSSSARPSRRRAVTSPDPGVP